MRYKVTVYKQGAMDQSIYGEDSDKLLARGVRILQRDNCSLKPLKAVLFRQERVLSGNRAVWIEVMQATL